MTFGDPFEDSGVASLCVRVMRKMKTGRKRTRENKKEKKEKQNKIRC